MKNQDKLIRDLNSIIEESKQMIKSINHANISNKKNIKMQSILHKLEIRQGNNKTKSLLSSLKSASQ